MTYQESLDRKRRVAEALAAIRLATTAELMNSAAFHGMCPAQGEYVAGLLAGLLLKPECRPYLKTLSEGA